MAASPGRATTGDMAIRRAPNPHVSQMVVTTCVCLTKAACRSELALCQAVANRCGCLTTALLLSGIRRSDAPAYLNQKKAVCVHYRHWAGTASGIWTAE